MSWGAASTNSVEPSSLVVYEGVNVFAGRVSSSTKTHGAVGLACLGSRGAAVMVGPSGPSLLSLMLAAGKAAVAFSRAASPRMVDARMSNWTRLVDGSPGVQEQLGNVAMGKLEM